MSNKKDFATSTISVEPTPQTSGTSITIQAGHGVRMPTVPFKATAHPDGELPTLDNAEKIVVTAVSGDDLTITRAQGGTTAKYISSGWRISNTIFEDDFDASNVNYDNSASGLMATNAQDAIDEAIVGLNDKVPISRTINGHALSGDVSVTKSDIGLGSVPNTDFTSAVATNTSKLAGIEDNAQVNVNADWNASSGDAQIINKPTLGTAAATDATDYATAAQGATADSAVQPGDLATVATSGSYSDLTGKPSIPAGLGDLSGTSDDVTQGTTNLFLTSAERTKLSNTSGTNTGDQTTITGNAGTATKLQTARNINGVAFDGTADITVADSTKVPTTTTVNGHALSSNVTVSKSDVGLGSVTNDAQLKASDLDTTTTLGTSDVKVPSQKAVKTYVDTNNTAALTTYDSTYLQSIGLSATTNTQDSVDGLAAGVFTYLGTIPNTYLNQTGQSGGQTAYGGFTSSDDLTIGQSNATWSSTSTGRTKIKGLVQFVGQTSVVNGAFPGLISFNETVNISGASVWALAGFSFNPTFQQDTSFGFGAAPAFNASPIFQPTAGGLNDSTNFLISSYLSGLNHKLAHSGAAGTTAMTAGYADSPSFTRASGTGTHTIARYSSLTSYQPVLFSYHVGAGYTATTMSTVYARNPSVSGGTITNNIAIDIDPMTSGSTINAGIRNASATINTPGTAQNITAASQAITIASTVKQLTANASYTLTSAPTIANGQDGQVVTIVNVDTTDTITLQDQGTLAGSNLRLSASSIALGPRDSIQLMYSSTIGDWVQIGQTNVI